MKTNIIKSRVYIFLTYIFLISSIFLNIYYVINIISKLKLLLFIISLVLLIIKSKYFISIFRLIIILNLIGISFIFISIIIRFLTNEKIDYLNFNIFLMVISFSISFFLLIGSKKYLSKYLESIDPHK